MSSEFGKGLVICLVKFAEHAMDFVHTLESYKSMRSITNPRLFSESSAVTIWANGASDHLYDIKTPKGKEWNEIRERVKELQKLGLDMGHGKGLMGTKIFKQQDVQYLINLTRVIALMIDKKIGLTPDIGEH